VTELADGGELDPDLASRLADIAVAADLEYWGAAQPSTLASD
jgi:hypothetical protein